MESHGNLQYNATTADEAFDDDKLKFYIIDMI